MNFTQMLKHPHLLANEMMNTVGSRESVKEHLQHQSYSNGIMTAVIISPEGVRPSEWLHKIVDLSGQQTSMEDAQLAVNLLLLEYYRIVDSLAKADQTYKPILWKDDFGRDVVADWAEGFHAGYLLRADAWAPLLKDDDARADLLPILLFHDALDLLSEIKKTDIDKSELLDAALAALPDSVQNMYNRWGAHRYDFGRAVQGSTNKIGRNQLCPCGSGLKYKKCCLTGR